MLILMQREKDRQEEKTGLSRNPGESDGGEGRAMITPALREALTKQGEKPSIAAPALRFHTGGSLLLPPPSIRSYILSLSVCVCLSSLLFSLLCGIGGWTH